jgi:ORF6N domain-containing protein
VHSTLAVDHRIDRVIVVVRGVRVILDADLAAMYGVSTRVLVQAVKRNPERFPKDFMLRLLPAEVRGLRSQNVISSFRHGGRRTPPYAFTEQGVAMLSSVLRSPKAIRVNIEIMRAFVRLRQMLHPTAVLARKIDDLERKYDGQFSVVFDAIRRLMLPSARSRIGFRA